VVIASRTARLTERRAGWHSAAFALGLALAAVVTGWLEVRHGAKLIGAVVVAIAAAVTIQRRAYGVMISVALLVSLNGVPGVNVNPGSNSISHYQDVAGLALLLGCGYVVFISGNVTSRSSLQRMLYVASSLLAAWWILTLARTVFFHGIPAMLAARFARDFMYFALLLPLLSDVFVTFPRLRRQVLVTLGIAAAIFAVAQIAHSRGHVSFEFILHTKGQFTTTVDGTTRIFSSMNDLVRVAFALSCGAVVLAPTRRLRYRAAVPMLLFGTSMLLQLTRAAYVGAALGFLLAGAIWWFRRGPIRGAARRRLILVPVLIVLVFSLGAAVSKGERHVLSTVGTRALAGFSDANSANGTVATRVNVGREMLRLLGPSWPIGLGFIHPAAHPYPTLPQGPIRDSDLGVLNALMLMGAVGAVLIYIPLLLVLRGLARAPRAGPDEQGDEWLRLGSAIWIIGTIASSLTLVDLFSFGGLQLSACVLAIATSVAVGRERLPGE
jgi:hypothetical protein